MSSRKKETGAFWQAWAHIASVLDAPGELPPRRSSRVRHEVTELQLSVASRGGMWRWAVLTATDGGAPIVREVFVSPLCMGAVRANPEISIAALCDRRLIRVRDATLDRATLDRRLRAARAISVPVVGVGVAVPVGVDGTSSTLSMGALRISWWSVPPVEWKRLVRWADSLRRLFERCLDREGRMGQGAQGRSGRPEDPPTSAESPYGHVVGTAWALSRRPRLFTPTGSPTEVIAYLTGLLESSRPSFGDPSTLDVGRRFADWLAVRHGGDDPDAVSDAGRICATLSKAFADPIGAMWTEFEAFAADVLSVPKGTYPIELAPSGFAHCVVGDGAPEDRAPKQPATRRSDLAARRGSARAAERQAARLPPAASRRKTSAPCIPSSPTPRPALSSNGSSAPKRASRSSSRS